MQKKVTRLIFFNTTFDVDIYLNQEKGFAQNITTDIIIAMNPNIRAYAKQHGVITQDTLPYFTNTSHQDLLKMSQEWTRCFFTQSFILKEKNAYQRSFALYLRCIFNYALWVIEIISNAIKQHEPDVILTTIYPNKILNSLYIETQEQYFSKILQDVCIQYQKQFHPWNQKEVQVCRKKEMRKNYSLGKFIAKLLFMKRHGFFILSMKMFLKKEVVFYTTKSYGMETWIKQFSENIASKKFYLLKECSILFSMDGYWKKIIWFFLGRKIKYSFCQKQHIENEIKIIKEHAVAFTYKGVSIEDILCSKVRGNLIPFLMWLSLWEKQMEAFLTRVKPRTILSLGDRVDDLIIADICKRQNIEVILISHGSHIPSVDEYASMEWQAHGKALLSAPFSTLALQSPLAEAFLKQFPSKSKTIRSGPLIWRRSVKLERSQVLLKKYLGGKFDLAKTKIIVHAATCKPSQALRPYVYETPDEYLQTLSELANVVVTIGSSVVLLIRFRSEKELSEGTLKEFLPVSENIILSTQDSFSDVLGMADLLISYSSTTIEEALQNKIPVLLYGGGGRYQHLKSVEILDENPLMKAPVYFLKEKHLLASGIRRILDLEIKQKEEVLFAPYIYPMEQRESMMRYL